MTARTWRQDELEAMLDGELYRCFAACRFVRPFAGGQSATHDGLKMFVEHHLKIDPDDPEFAKTVARIEKEDHPEKIPK